MLSGEAGRKGGVVVRGRRGAWYATAGLILGALALAGSAGAEESTRCSAWRSAEKPHDRIELRTCELVEAEGAEASEAEAKGAEAKGAQARDAEAKDAEAKDAAPEAVKGEGEGEAAEATYEVEIRSGYGDERKLRVELVTSGGAVQTLEATVAKGVTKAGSCQECRAPGDVEKWRILESTRAKEADTLRKIAPTRDMEVLARDLRLTDADAERLKRIAASYHKATRKRLVVTGGTRPPQRQAQLMYDKLKRGDDIVALYENKPAALEVRAAYRDGAARSLSRKRQIRAMTAVIEAQMARGVFVSKHLRSGAVDVRSWDMTPAMEQALRDAIKKEPGVSLMDERSSAEPHFHLSFL